MNNNVETSKDFLHEYDHASEIASPDPTDHCTLKLSPLENANLLSLLTIHWIQPLISLGAQRPLEKEDVPPLLDKDKCAILSKRFDSFYCSTSCPVVPRVFYAIFMAFREPIFTQTICYLLYTALTAIQPFLVQSLLDFISDKPQENFNFSNGYEIVAVLSVSSIVAVICLNYGFYTATRVGVNIRSISMDKVYQKSLKLTPQVRQLTTTGNILTLMSVDSERIFEASVICEWALIAPMSIFLCFILIAIFFSSITALCGFLCVLIIFAVAFWVASKIGAARTNLVASTTERVKITSEVLQGIRVMKFYGWEDSIIKRVIKVREREIKHLKIFQYWRIFNMGFLFLAPVFLSGVVLSVYVGLGNTITVTKVFTLIAFVNISRFGINAFPAAVAAGTEGYISVMRLDHFLNHDELDSSHTSDGDQFIVEHCTPQIVLKAMSCSWDEHINEPSTNDINSELSRSILRNITLDIKPGSLTVIVGAVGAGKSSIISAILGEMNVLSGTVEVNGNIAYCSQEAWIRNATVQDNIIFGEVFDRQWYDTIIKASQLFDDLKVLAAADMTMVGERGINLSGGQKARIGLARVFYRKDSQILLLDDPLSAVDVHVAKGLFYDGIMGIAKSKTRVLVLNSHYQFLSSADRILVMDEGNIVGDGSYGDICIQFPHLVSSLDKDSNETTIVHTSPLLSALPRAPNSNWDSQLNEQFYEQPTTNELIEEEDREKGSISYRTYVTYFQHSGYNGGLIIVLILVSFSIGQYLRVLTDWWQAEWAVNEEAKIELTKDKSTRKSLYYGLVLLAIIVVATIVIIGRFFFFIYVAVRCSYNLHNSVLKRILRAPINTFFDVTPVGRILNRFSRDLDQADSILPDFALHFLTQLSVIGSVLITCLISSWYLAFSYIPMIAIFFITGKYFENTSRELKRLEGVTRSPIFNSFSETLNGLQIIRAFKMENYFNVLNQSAVDDNCRFFFNFWASSYWLAIRLDLLSVVLISAVSLCFILTKGSIEPDIAGLALTYALSITSALQWCVRVWNNTENSMTAVERILHYKSINTEAADVIESSRPPSNWPSTGNIEFQDLCLRYRPDLDLVLRGINLSINGGDKIGVCGRTGAGKSSLMIALFRIVEFDSGTVFIDGIDISKIGLKDLRSKLSIIPQDPVLFSGTLRENLDPFETEQDEVLWKALYQVNLSELVKSSPAGDLSFVVSEKGENFSLGQRQLVCIARALIRKSKIIVMDEATANVDLETDTLIQSAIRNSFQDQTILTIAHRLDTIMDSDKILVLDNGCVSEFDSPRELLSNPKSLFWSLSKNAGLL